MEGLKNRIIPNEEFLAEAKRLGGIKELLSRAKEILNTNVLDINYPLRIVNTPVFIDEARERCRQLTDLNEQKKYQAAIDEVYALWSKKCDEAMGISNKES